MKRNRASSIKSWIKTMGFELTKSHLLDHRTKKVKYYTLGNFGVYEEITPAKRVAEKKQKFISWTPWGDSIEVHSVKELSKAYEEFIDFDANVALN